MAFSMQIPIREMYIISDGKIVWIDMGMMGRLSDRDRELISDAIQGIAINDIGMIQDAVLALGEFRGKPDQSKLYRGYQQPDDQVLASWIWEISTWQRQCRI